MCFDVGSERADTTSNAHEKILIWLSDRDA
jgi:hypothetical protein